MPQTLAKKRGIGRKRRRSGYRRELRSDLFKSASTFLHERVEAVLNNANEETLVAANRFLARAIDTKKIPCAFVSGGDSVSSLTRLFAQIENLKLDRPLERRVFVTLTDKDCSTLKSCLKKIVTSAISTGRPLKIGPKILDYDLNIINYWISYQALQAGESVTFVIVLESVQCVGPMVLNELLAILHYHESVKFRLICGVAGAMDLVMAMLETKTLTRLDACIINVRTTSGILDEIVREIFLKTGNGMTLGKDVYTFLLDNFHDFNQSPEMFVVGIHYALMCHYQANTLSWLTTFSDENSLSLSAEECQTIRCIQSVRRHVEALVLAQDTTRAAALLSDDNTLCEAVKEWKADIRRYRYTLENTVSVLLSLGTHVEAAKGRSKSWARLYQMVLQQELGDSRYLGELLQNLKVMRADRLRTFLSSAAENVTEQDLATFLRDCERELTAIERDDGDCTSDDLGEESGAEGDEEAGIGRNPLQTAETKLRAASVRQTATAKRAVTEAIAASLSPGEERYTRLVDRIYIVVSRLFERSGPLRSYESLPLHELFWYNLLRPHTSVFTARIRQSVHHALADPTFYLGPISKVPETAATYQLFLDSGQLVNLYDWFQAFKQMYTGGLEKEKEVEEEEEEEEKKEEEEEEEKEEDEGDEQENEETGDRLLQALFTRSVEELRFLGLFVSTKRKTDHVKKIVVL